MRETSKIPQAAVNAITAMNKFFFWTLRSSSSPEESGVDEEEELPSFEIALLMSEAVTPLAGKSGGLSGSISQTVSSPVG